MHARNRRLLLRILIATLAVAFLVWYVPFAHRRLTTLPSREPDDYSDLIRRFQTPGPDDATREWLDALAKLPPDPVFDEPPPAGMRWLKIADKWPGPGTSVSVEPKLALIGPWDPSSRPVLRVLISFLGSDAVTTALDAVTSLRGRPFVQEATSRQRESPVVTSEQLANLRTLLCARSRYRRMALRDPLGAWDDLQTLVTLIHQPRDTRTRFFTAVGCEEALASELRYWLHEEPVNEPTAAEITAALASFPGPDVTWADFVAGELETERHYIAVCFSDDGAGNGWLVLSSQPSEWFSSMSLHFQTTKLSPLWNLLSPLYHDRRSAEQRLNAYFQQVAAVRDLPYGRAISRLAGLGRRGVYDPADGAFLMNHPRSYEYAYKWHVRLQTRLSAARIMLGLNGFRARHRRYPDSLAMLVPDFLPALPTDPFCGGPFGYRRDGEDYLLYACGENGKDDGGIVFVDEDGTRQPFGPTGDEVLTGPRPPVKDETKLETIDAAQQ